MIPDCNSFSNLAAISGFWRWLWRKEMKWSKINCALTYSRRAPGFSCICCRISCMAGSDNICCISGSCMARFLLSSGLSSMLQRRIPSVASCSSRLGSKQGCYELAMNWRYHCNTYRIARVKLQSSAIRLHRFHCVFECQQSLTFSEVTLD